MSPSMLAFTWVKISCVARERPSSNILVPPRRKIFLFVARFMASCRVFAPVTFAGSFSGVRVTTMFWRWGSGRPRLVKVVEPMMTDDSFVTSLKFCKSAFSFQGRVPFLPMIPFWLNAAIIVISLFMAFLISFLYYPFGNIALSR